LTSFNLHLFRWVNNWPESWSPFLRLFSEAVNQVWFKVGIAILLVAMLAAGKKSRATAILALIAVGLANTLTDQFKHFMPDPRPYQEILHVIPRAGLTKNMGTASAHAANMAAVATVFLVRQRWWGLPWLIVAILTGISRVYVGAHYPYQVLLGWTCGVAIALLVLSVYQGATRRGIGVRSGKDGINGQDQP